MLARHREHRLKGFKVAVNIAEDSPPRRRLLGRTSRSPAGAAGNTFLPREESLAAPVRCSAGFGAAPSPTADACLGRQRLRPADHERLL